MYRAITYKDRAGKDDIADYINSLNKQINTSKDARIKYKKILEYIGKLEKYGLSIGEPTIRHLTGTDLWELRPIDDRIIFAYWKDNIFILLHQFVKKTQKTPPREIAQAERNLKDFLERYGD